MVVTGSFERKVKRLAKKYKSLKTALEPLLQLRKVESCGIF
jgi:hypothetical protein